MLRALYKLTEQWKYKRHAAKGQIAIQNIGGEVQECRMIMMEMETWPAEKSPKGGKRMYRR